MTKPSRRPEIYQVVEDSHQPKGEHDDQQQPENQPAEPQASTPSEPRPADPVPFSEPAGSPIEVAATGTGTTNDPSGKDKPPSVYSSDFPRLMTEIRRTGLAGFLRRAPPRRWGAPPATPPGG